MADRHTTVYELIQKLSQYPPNTPVEVARSLAFKRPMRVIGLYWKSTDSYSRRPQSEHDTLRLLVDWYEDPKGEKE